MAEVKDQTNLARAFVRLVSLDQEAKRTMRLIMVGDGPLRAETEAILAAAGIRDLAWFATERDDVPAILGNLDCFALPSLAEGISNTILEAMACGLPVVATRVGGNAELIEEGSTGLLVPPADSEALAAGIATYFRARDMAKRHGAAGRRRTQTQYSLDVMVGRYDELYRRALRGRGVPTAVTEEPGAKLKPSEWR